MTNINPTTPQLKVLKDFVDALETRDIKNAEPLLSKDFTFTTSPKSADLPDLTREEYLQKFGALFAFFAKVEVGTIYLGASFESAC
jgi:hypothetical protein